jgi:hypothetical protein
MRNNPRNVTHKTDNTRGIYTRNANAIHDPITSYVLQEKGVTSAAYALTHK